MRFSTPFVSPSGVYEWLQDFINMERDLSSRPMKLEAMKALASFAGNPENCAPAIHTAGSKGKGSVTAMTAAILEKSGRKTARYASPHVRDFRERISLGNCFFDDKTYAAAGNELRSAAGLFIKSGGIPTFFELFTLWFFLCARISGCNAMAVETGLGGRLDATNIINPLVSVITVIEKEHAEILGDTIAEISGEKAGIIKPGKPLVLAEQNAEAFEVFRQKAAAAGSLLLYFPEICEIKNLKLSREGSVFDLRLDLPAAAFCVKELHVPLPGEIQAKNSGLAVIAAKTAFPGIDEKSVREGLASFSLPARFEKINASPPFIIDGAHTALSVGETVSVFTRLYGAGGVLLFGCAGGKDAEAMAEKSVPHFSTIIITTPGTFKKSSPRLVYETFTCVASLKKSGAEIIFMPETKAAIQAAMEKAEAKGLPILGTGSFYLAAEITSELKT